MYQPRGVGLMHTRHNPGNAHYTHGTATECKSQADEKLVILEKTCAYGHLS